MHELDLAIIGGGPAGMAAGVYSARALLKTGIFEKMAPGGMVLLTAEIENYPGFLSISGFELMKKMEEHAKKFGTEFITTEVKSITKKDNRFLILASSGVEYVSKAVIIATGTQNKKLDVPGEKEFSGRGVSYCATCDGAFFRDLVVAVVGGGNTACEEAIFLTKFAKKVYLIHRRNALRADKIVQRRLMDNEKIEVIWDSVVLSIEGDDKVENLKLKNVKNGKISDLKIDGVFIFIGLLPNTQWLNGMVNLDNKGFIVTDNNLMTSIEGIFAAGDVRSTVLRQVVTAVSDGAIAAVGVEKYIEKL